MNRSLLLSGLLLFLLSCGPSPPIPTPRRSGLDPKVTLGHALVGATAIEVLSLDPTSGQNVRINSSFHGWPLRERVLVSAPLEVSSLAAALADDLSSRDLSVASPCEILPRYGIYVSGVHPLDLVISFECQQAEAYAAGTASGLGTYRISGASQRALDPILARSNARP